MCNLHADTWTTLQPTFTVFSSIGPSLAKTGTIRVALSLTVASTTQLRSNLMIHSTACLASTWMAHRLTRSVFRKRDEIKAFSDNRLWEETNKNFSVLSLSEVNDNILMWSHYTDCHTGICLDLTFETSAELHQVLYTDVRPEFYFTDVREQDRDHERFKKVAISTLTTKAPDWAYEKEWRCIDFGGPGERPMPHGMLAGIIFGCRTSETDKRMVHEWVESGCQSVRFYQAIQRDGVFALDIKEIH